MRQAGTQSIGIGANGIWGNRGAIGEEGNDGRRRGVNSPSGGLLNSADDGGLSNPRNRYRKALETSHRGPEGPAHVRRRFRLSPFAARFLNKAHRQSKSGQRQGGLAERGKGKGEGEGGGGERECERPRWVWEERARDSPFACKSAVFYRQ